MQELSRKDHSFVFVDASPSELIHKLTDKILILSLINFHNIELDQVRLRQFKETRTLDRKLKAQDYIIDCFETGKISGYGIIAWNTQKLALYNANKLLASEGLLTKEQLYSDERIFVAEESISVGHFLSLAWYTLVLSQNASTVAYMTKFEKKQKAAILLDLLPGDSLNSSRNLNVVRYIINHSPILDGLFKDAIVNNKLTHIGFGYGMKDGSTKELKNQPPYTVTDWITQSFYSKLRCEKIVKDEHYDDNIRFSLLANYLMDKKFFLIATPFTLTE